MCYTQAVRVACPCLPCILTRLVGIMTNWSMLIILVGKSCDFADNVVK